MYRFIVLVLTVVLQACSTTGVSNYSYNLDVPEQRYSFFDFKNIGDAVTLEINATFIEQRKTPEWNPSASFQIFSKDENVYAALVIPNSEGSGYQPFLISNTKNPKTGEISSIEPVYFAETIDFSASFTVTVTWFTPGVLRVTLNNNETKTIPIDFVVDKLRSANSSGEIEVRSLVINKCNKSKHSDAASCAGI